MSMPLCKNPPEEVEQFVVEQFHKGIGSARTSTQIAIKFKIRVPYSYVLRVLNKNGLRRTKQEAYAVSPACDRRTTLETC